MNIHGLTAALLLLSAAPAMAQVQLAQTGYSLPEPLEVAPGQVVLLSTGGIPTRAGRTGTSIVVSIPEAELDGIRASVNYTGFSPLSVSLLGVRQAACEGSTSTACDPLTSLTVVLPLAVPSSGATGELVINDRGRDVRRIPIRTVPDRIHAVSTCDQVAVHVGSNPGEECGHVIRRAAGGRQVTAQDPARLGDTVVVWAYGLGVHGRPVEVDGGRLTPVLNPPTVRFAFASSDLPFIPPPGGAGSAPAFAAAFPPTPLYQINVTLPQGPLPPNLKACDGTSVKWNLTIFLSGLSSMDAVRLCVLP